MTKMMNQFEGFHECKDLWDEFKLTCNGQGSPLVVDTIGKARFFIMKGYEKIMLMHQAEKEGLAFAHNGWRHVEHVEQVRR